MTHLPLDYSRCTNDTCTVRTSCLRYTDRPEEPHLVTPFEEGDEGCEYFIFDPETETKEKPTP